MKFSKYGYFLFRIFRATFFCSFILFILRICDFFNNLLFEQIFFAVFLNALLFLIFFFYKGFREERIFLEIIIASLFFLNIANFSLINIDRSRSFYVLSWVEQSKVVLNNSKVDLSKVYSNERLNTEAIKLRLDEQISRGLVYIDENEYRLTQFGKVYLLAAEYLAKIYKLDNWSTNKK